MRGYRTTDGPGLRIVVAERRLRQPRSPSVVPAFRWTRGLAVHDVVDLFAMIVSYFIKASAMAWHIR